MPPVVPRPASIPALGAANHAASATTGMTGAALDMDWDEEELPTNASGLEGVEALPDPDDGDPTRQMVVSETFTGRDAPLLESPTGAGPAAVPPSAPVPAQPAHEVSPTPARSPILPVVAVVAGIVAVIAGALYIARGDQPGSLYLTTEPKDVAVTVDGERVAATASPFVLDGLTPGRHYAVTVAKRGYRTWSSRLSVRPGQSLSLPTIVLEPSAAELEGAPEEPQAKTPSQPPNSRAPAPRQARPAEAASAPEIEPRAPPQARRTQPAAGTAKRARRPTPKPAPAKRVRPTPAVEAKPQGKGVLRINSRPWSRVIVDGRLVGNTPQTNIRLSAGKHRVRLVNPKFKMERTLSVTIRPDETVTKIVDLE